MSKQIYKAVANLPEALITLEIANAAIEEANIELLDTLPHKYLTSDVILKIIEKNNEGYRWDKFDLSNIPENLRTNQVCEFAVAKDTDNITSVPREHISSAMLSSMVKQAEPNMRFLHLFPETLWTAEQVYVAIRNIYSNTYTKYGPRGGYHGNATSYHIDKVQIFLSYVPKRIKNEKFYISLFDTDLTVEDILLITPDKHKREAFYNRVAGGKFNLVPIKFYSYDTFISALRKNRISFEPPYSYRGDNVSEREEHKELMQKLFSMMDAAMADVVIDVMPDKFLSLPTKFQSESRLIKAIESHKNSDPVQINIDYQPQMFTTAVCKAYVRAKRKMPIFPLYIWTAEFVQYCLENGNQHYWVEKMPTELQTQEVADTILSETPYNIKYIRPEFVSLEVAQKIYREETSSRQYIPKCYLDDFKNETGLEEEFFGGDVTLSTLRNTRPNYSYCRLGHNILAFIDESNYRSKSYKLRLMRRTPGSFRPVQIFERQIETFHTTWLEKMIADNDASFKKPAPHSKSEKPYAYNPYYALKKIEEYKGAMIYSNYLLGERVLYSTITSNGEICFNPSLDDIKKSIKAAFEVQADVVEKEVAA